MIPTATSTTAQSARRQNRHSRDPDGVTALVITMVNLAIADYLSGPASGHYARAESFLRRTGLLERVHERHGTPAHVCAELYRQLELFT